MTHTLVALLAADGRAIVGWSAFDAAGRETAHGSSADIAVFAATPPRRIVVIAPGSEVFCTHATVPPGAGSRAQAALAYALEDDLAAPVDTLHVARGPTGADGRTVAAAVARGTMERWLATLAGFGLRPDAIVPDFLALDPGAEPAAIRMDGRCVVSLTDGTGFSVEPELCDHILPQLAPGGSARLVECDPSEFLRRAWARNARSPVFNLLQGGFAPARPWSIETLVWRRTSVLAASLAALFVAQQWSAAVDARARAAAAYASAEHLARDVLPPGTRLVNARAQVQAQRSALATQSDDAFLGLGEALAAALAATPGTQLQSVRFDAGRGALGTLVSAPDYAGLDALKAKLDADGLAVEEGEARQSGARVTGEFSLKRR